MDTNHERKVAIISGFTGLVGSTIAKRLSCEGFVIAGLYHNATEDMVKERIASLDGEVHRAYRCDLYSVDDISKTLQEVRKDFGSIDVCVHAAWEKPKRKLILNCTTEEIANEVTDGVAMSFALLCQCALYCKEQKKGTIIGITTSGVLLSEDTRGMGGYIPAKYALQGILTSLREELKGSGVSVYSVAPSFMEGGMNRDFPKAFIDIMKEKSVTKMLTTPDDVAEVVSSLCLGAHTDDTTMNYLVTPHNA